jgi:hypothetical protein
MYSKVHSQRHDHAGINFGVITVMILLLWINFAWPQNARITEYDVPISRANRLDFSGMMQLSGIENQTSIRYDADCHWEQYYNSLPYAYSWIIDGYLYIQEDNRPYRKATYREIIAAEAEFRKYVKEDGLVFFAMAGNADWNYRYKHVDSWVGGSVGMGRFIIATALAKALRIEEFLIKEAILAVHLPNEVMLELASIIDRKYEYQRRYGDTYMVWWFADMDKAIIASGLIPSMSVGPVGMLRMREVIERETVRPRMYGWQIETGAGIKFSKAYEGRTIGTQPFISATYGLPIGLKSQLYLYGRAYAQPDERIGEMFNLYVKLTFSHELSNCIDFMLSETYRHRKNESQASSPTQTTLRKNALKADFIFYLENKIALTTYAQLNHLNEYRTDFKSSLRRRIRRDWLLGASVSYRIY